MILRSATTRTVAIGLAAVAGTFALGACSSNSSSSGDASASASGTPSVSADAALAAQVPDAIKSTGKLAFGTDASYAPSEFIAEDGSTIVGFDVDLGNAIAAKLGLQGQWSNSSFDSLIVGVQNGKFNSSMSSFTINPDRLKQANMVSYFSAGTAWAAATGNPKNVDPNNACGKTVAVQKATVQATDDIPVKQKACKDAGQPAINVQQYNLQSDATTAVVSGKADAMLADSPVIAYAIKQTGKLEQVGEITGAAPYGIVVAKDQTDFAKTIQAATQALIDDGAYKQILTNWGVESGAITKAELNPVPAS
ncbi:MAG: ABC transporter substrate-binding protein [Candidatus Nanopelagicales bacterium]